MHSCGPCQFLAMHLDLPNLHAIEVKDNISKMRAVLKLEFSAFDKDRESQGFIIINHKDILNLFN